MRGMRGTKELDGGMIAARDAEARLDHLMGMEAELETAVQRREDEASETAGLLSDEEDADSDPGRMELLRRGLEEAEEKLEEARGDLEDFRSECGEELERLEEEEPQIRDASRSGETLVREDRFAEYAESLCRDTGALPEDIPRYIEIDWEKTAENLKPDYITVTLHCGKYLVRG